MSDERSMIVAALTAAIWRAMDAGLDEAEIRDAVDQAVRTWEPDADPLLARWRALKPRVEALGPDDELDADDLTEAITVVRKMDQANDPAYAEAREWFRTNGLPTTWRPSART